MEEAYWTFSGTAESSLVLIIWKLAEILSFLVAGRRRRPRAGGGGSFLVAKGVPIIILTRESWGVVALSPSVIN